MYLTRGKSATTRAVKAFKTAHSVSGKVTGAMKKVDLSFISPKVLAERSACYDEINGKVVYIIKERVQALPLFGIQYEKEITLGSLVADKLGITKAFEYANKAVSIMGKIQLLKKIDKWLTNDKTPEPESNNPFERGDITTVLDYTEKKIQDKFTNLGKALGQELNFKVTIKGEYQANYEVAFNITTNHINFDESYGNYKISGPRVAFGNKKGIDAVAKCELKTGFTINTDYIINYAPTFIPHVYLKAKAEGEAEIHGSFFYERIYGIDRNEAYYIDNTLFSGIAGTVKGQAKIKDTDKNRKDTKQSTKTINESFVLMEPYVLKGKKIPLFSKESFKEHL